MSCLSHPLDSDNTGTATSQTKHRPMIYDECRANFGKKKLQQYMHTTHISISTYEKLQNLIRKAPPGRQHKVDSGYLLLHPISTCHDLKPSHDPRFTLKITGVRGRRENKRTFSGRVRPPQHWTEWKEKYPQVWQGHVYLAKVPKTCFTWENWWKLVFEWDCPHCSTIISNVSHPSCEKVLQWFVCQMHRTVVKSDHLCLNGLGISGSRERFTANQLESFVYRC